jgi:glycosyltransferase involved in cell wall biosynthesis
MRIGIEAQRLFRRRKHGMDIVILEQLREIQSLTTEIEFIVYVRPGPDQCLDSTENVKIRMLTAPTYPLWEQWALPKAAAEDRVDLLHCTSNTGPVHCGVPLVVTLHDIIFLESAPSLKDGRTPYQTLGSYYRRWNVPKVISNARQILTVSHYERSRIEDRFPELASRLSVVYNGVSKSFMARPGPDAVRHFKAQHQLPDRFVLFLGNTDPKKNLRNVILGHCEYASSTDSPLPLVVGDLRRSVIERLVPESRWALDRGLIEFPGYIAHRDMPLLYSAADLLLYPSLRESFGLPILEAMASATPVITSNTASMPEVAGDAGLLVDPTQPSDIGSLTSFILNSDLARRSLIQRGLDRVNYFSWRQSSTDLLRVYKQLLDPTEHVSARAA